MPDIKARVEKKEGEIMEGAKRKPYEFTIHLKVELTVEVVDGA